MHFTCSICTVTSWDQITFVEVTPQEENKTSFDSPKDHLHVKFPQCLPGEKRKGKFGWTAISTGERKSTTLSLQTGLFRIKCKPLSKAWSGFIQLWSKGVEGTNFPLSANLVFVSKMLHYYMSGTDNVPWRYKIS